MANASAENVLYIDTNNTPVPGPLKICGIKYLGAATSSVILRSKDASGAILWSEDGTTDIFEDPEIKASDGIYVNITGPAAVFIYLE
jgi:hypothetical protein